MSFPKKGKRSGVDRIPRMKGMQSQVDRRVEPAILILNKEGSPVYQNQSALQLLGLIPRKKFSERPSKRSSFSQMLFELYIEFKSPINKSGNGEGASAPMNRILRYKGARYLLRSVPIKGSDHSHPTHLLVLFDCYSDKKIKADAHL